MEKEEIKRKKRNKKFREKSWKKREKWKDWVEGRRFLEIF
jgi:hypothetical protein